MEKLERPRNSYEMASRTGEIASEKPGKKILTGEIASDKSLTERKYTTKHGTESTMNVSRATTNSSDDYDPEENATQELHDTIELLRDENQQLKDKLTANNLFFEGDETPLEETVIDLRRQIKALEVEIEVVKASRNKYQIENAEMKRQLFAQRKEIEKLSKTAA